MCKRILNLKDNELYTFAQVGLKLNDYFIKNNLKVKNHNYELHKFKDICMAEGLGPGKHKGSELYPIAQKEIDRVKANQPGKKAPAKKTVPVMTPIEEMAEKTAQEFKKAEAAKVITEEPETIKADPDEFEAKRKKFYTDVHYFMKLCSTPEERTAMLYALAALYGFTNIQKEG